MESTGNLCLPEHSLDEISDDIGMIVWRLSVCSGQATVIKSVYTLLRARPLDTYEVVFVGGEY